MKPQDTRYVTGKGKCADWRLEGQGGGGGEGAWRRDQKDRVHEGGGSWRALELRRMERLAQDFAGEQEKRECRVNRAYWSESALQRIFYIL